MFEELAAVYDTRAASCAGEWMELFKPGTIEPAVHPRTGKKLRLKLLGPESPKREAAMQEIGRRRAQVVSLANGKAVDPRLLWDIEAEGFAECVVDWDGFDEPFSTDNAVLLFKRFRPWFVQADNWGAARANFLIRPTGNGLAAASHDLSAASISASESRTDHLAESTSST